MVSSAQSRGKRPGPSGAGSRAARGRAYAPGVTILEVVLSVVMLGLVTASLTGAISAIEAMSARNKKMVAAYEIANRLVLTWLDNPKLLPPSSLPLDYGPYTFMWDSDLIGVEMKINDTQRRISGSTPQALDRFEVITITVYDTEGEGPQPRPGDELAVLSRMYDPAAARNPESMKNIVEGENLERLINKLGGGAALPARKPSRRDSSRDRDR